MPYTAQKADVEHVFREGGFEVVDIDISIDPFLGRNPSYCFVDLVEVKSLRGSTSHVHGNKWYAFVDLATAEEARRAAHMLDGMEICCGKLAVNVTTRSPSNLSESQSGEEHVRGLRLEETEGE